MTDVVFLNDPQLITSIDSDDRIAVLPNEARVPANAAANPPQAILIGDLVTQLKTLLIENPNGLATNADLANRLLTSTFNTTLNNYSTTTEMNAAITAAIQVLQNSITQSNTGFTASINSLDRRVGINEQAIADLNVGGGGGGFTAPFWNQNTQYVAGAFVMFNGAAYVFNASENAQSRDQTPASYPHWERISKDVYAWQGNLRWGSGSIVSYIDGNLYVATVDIDASSPNPTVAGSGWTRINTPLAGTSTLLTTGTDSTARIWSARIIHDYIDGIVADSGQTVVTNSSLVGTGRTGSPLGVAFPFNASDRTKLDSIESGAQVNPAVMTQAQIDDGTGTTGLLVTPQLFAANVSGITSVNTDATLTGNGNAVALSVAEPYTAAERTKLAGVAENATANPNALDTVATNNTLSGDGTASSPLEVANPFTQADNLKLAGIAANATANPNALDSVATNATITGDGTSGSPLAVANEFTDADETKLDGIATGAEVNPPVITQEEIDAGTSTEERVITPALLAANMGSSTGGGGGGSAGGVTELHSSSFFYGQTGIFREFAGVNLDTSQYDAFEVQSKQSGTNNNSKSVSVFQFTADAYTGLTSSTGNAAITATAITDNAQYTAIDGEDGDIIVGVSSSGNLLLGFNRTGTLIVKVRGIQLGGGSSSGGGGGGMTLIYDGNSNTDAQSAMNTDGAWQDFDYLTIQASFSITSGTGAIFSGSQIVTVMSVMDALPARTFTQTHSVYFGGTSSSTSFGIAAARFTRVGNSDDITFSLFPTPFGRITILGGNYAT